MLKDYEFSDRAAMNLKLKNNGMSRPVGYIEGGAGYADKFLYKGGVFGFMANNKQQVLFSTKANNTTEDTRRELVSHYGSKSVLTKAGMLIPPVTISIPFLLKKRSGYNNTELASVNGIKKIDNETIAKTNLSYQREREKNSNETLSIYYLGDNTIRVEEALREKHVNNKIEGSVQYQKNASNVYIDNTLSTNINWGNTLTNIESSVNHNQDFTTKQFNVNNKLNLKWRIKNNVFSINSFVSGGNIPKNILRITSSNLTRPIEQEVSGYSIYTKHAISFIKGFNAYSNLNLDLYFESESDKILTDLINESLPKTYKNHNQGHKLTTTALLIYTYSKNKINFRFFTPLQYLYFNYDHSNFTLHKPVISPGFSLYYRFTPIFKASLSGSFNHQYGDILSFIEQPIQKAYNNISRSGLGILAENKQKRMALGYDYRNTMNGVFSTFSIGYYVTRKNILKGTTILSDKTISAFNTSTENTSNHLNTNFYIAKNFQDVKTVISLTSGFISSRNRQLRQEQSANYTNNVILLTPSISCNTLDWFVIRASGLFNYVTQKVNIANKNLNSHTKNWGTNVELFILPIKKLEFYYDLEYNIQQKKNQVEKFCFMDCGLRYHHSKALEFYLELNNLTNTRYYKKIIHNELDYFETVYSIRPHNIMLGFKVNY